MTSNKEYFVKSTVQNGHAVRITRTGSSLIVSEYRVYVDGAYVASTSTKQGAEARGKWLAASNCAPFATIAS